MSTVVGHKASSCCPMCRCEKRDLIIGGISVTDLLIQFFHQRQRGQKMYSDRKPRPLAQAIQLATEKCPHPSTPDDWVTRGICGVQLETWMIGGRRMTTVLAVRRFLETTAGNNSYRAYTPTPGPTHDGLGGSANRSSQHPSSRLWAPTATNSENAASLSDDNAGSSQGYFIKRLTTWIARCFGGSRPATFR